MGWTTVRKWGDVLFAMALVPTYPVIVMLVKMPGGDAGLALIVLPVIILPFLFVGILLGWRVSKNSNTDSDELPSPAKIK